MSKEQILIYLYLKAKNYRDDFLKQESPDCCPRGSSLQVSQPTNIHCPQKKEGCNKLVGHGNLKSIRTPRRQQNGEKHGSFTLNEYQLQDKKKK